MGHRGSYCLLVILAALPTWSLIAFSFPASLALALSLLLEVLVLSGGGKSLREAKYLSSKFWICLVATPLLFLSGLVPLALLALPLALVYGLSLGVQLLAAAPFLALISVLLLAALANSRFLRPRALDPSEEFAASVLRDIEALPLLRKGKLDYRH